MDGRLHIKANGAPPENLQPRLCPACGWETIHVHLGLSWVHDDEVGYPIMAHSWMCTEPGCGAWRRETSYDYPD